jgi:arylsulfatase A-like enzyme
MKPLSRREFLARTGAAGALAASLREARAAPAGKGPNIIWIMADDLGYADLGCYGQEHILTPNIDHLAAEGTRFTQCYAGSTVCAPSRSVLMTGLHTGHTTVRGNFSAIGKGRVPLRAADVTVAEVLKRRGYATGIVGKWGLGEPNTEGVPNRQGFDFWFGFLNQRRAHSYYPPYVWRNEEKFPLEANAGGKRGQYVHDLFTREGLGFIRRSVEAGKPFFLYGAYTIPHGRYEIPSDAPYSDKPWSGKLKNYAAMVTRLDRDVGSILSLLKELGVADETIVFFTSDNGAAFVEKTFQSSGRLRGHKRSLHEGGIRVPMIVRWPGQVAAGAVRDAVWTFWDFLPTAAQLAGAEAPDGIDGVSVVPVLLGKAPPPRRRPLYWEFHERRFVQAVRMGDWKALRYGLDGKLELYDLKADPSEKKDVAAEHADVVARIEAYLKTARSVSRHWPARKARPEA